ncbi:MAG: thioredoxin domain-containing protein, partial [Candidatus Binatia bacterium]
MEHKHTNRLIHETSPYLLQHAHNPVDWYGWGEDAFQKAKAEDKPILLSIGYSACHWCHVMERESFENEEIARLMNQLFVNIKVDREERPDLDEIYMSAVQMLTGRGGWPMTMFLTPDRKPFYGGTYFPPEDRGGMPGFAQVLMGVNQAYRERPADVEKSVTEILGALRRMAESAETDKTFSKTIIAEGAAKVAQAYDADNGGLG